MINVQIGIAVYAVDQEGDSLLEGAFLFIGIVAPEGMVNPPP